MLPLPLALSLGSTACDADPDPEDEALRGGVEFSGPADGGGDKQPVGDPHINAGPDQRRFVRGDQSWYAAGYYAGAAVNMTGQDYAGNYAGYNEDLVDALDGAGVNYMRIWANWGAVSRAPGGNDDWDDFVKPPWPRTGPGNALDNRPKLDLSTDPEEFDSSYFKLLGAMVERATDEDHDMVVQLILLDCWHMGPNGQSFGFGDYDFFDDDNNINGVEVDGLRAWSDPSGPVFPYHAAYVRKVVETVGGHPVVWEICNEPNRSGGKASERLHEDFDAAITTVIRQAEQDFGHPRHLIMPNDLPEHRDVSTHDRAISTLTDADFIHDELVAQFASNQVLIYDNDSFTPLPTLDLLRALIWGVFTAGANVDVFDENLYKSTVLGSGPATARMQAVGNLGSFAARFDLVGMTPRDGDLVRGWAFGHAGEQYLVYLPQEPGPQTLRLPGLVGKGCEVRWYDPRTGTDGMIDSGRCDQDFTAPTDEDWAAEVIVVDGPAVGLIASYRPASGAARVTRKAYGEHVPSLSYFYDESLGHFEQRPGAPCNAGQNNSTYLTMRYEGADTIDGCQFQASWDAAPVTCSPAVIANLDAGVEAVINTDLHAHDPATCQPFDESIHVGFGTREWLRVDFVIDGQTYRREFEFTKQSP
ncbi:hypothetical protein ACNOYE_38310 [Nannocystaceae bacterium ST9]